MPSPIVAGIDGVDSCALVTDLEPSNLVFHYAVSIIVDSLVFLDIVPSPNVSYI